jgi:hypothetical protein
VQDGEGAAERRGSPALKPEYGSQPYDSNYILASALQTLPGGVTQSTERQEHTGSIRVGRGSPVRHGSALVGPGPLRRAHR